jgi:DNA-binding winged helix-turn-helix (wHTH) protein/predicted ATPase
VNQELWRGEERLPLRGKPFAVLAFLATHPARLVQRAELAQAVWPDTHVSEGLLRGYVRELRAVLGDDAAEPRFIETVARRGYRFVAPLRGGAERPLVAAAPSRAQPPAPRVVGRKEELEDLERRFAEAAAGVRRVVFVSGEAGIGKTTLVDGFVRGLRARGVRIARGQCLEHFGVGEAHLPLLEALGGLCRLPRGREAVAVLARFAPTWLVEMPALAADAELEAVRRRVQGATRERMLREFAEAVEVLTATEPLVLVLEDLHWSDHSTLDVLSSLARRREPARLLVVGTYRSEDVVGCAHPLATIQQELQVHGLCGELALRPLDADEVAEYVVARFPREPLAPHIGRSIHQATEGNPLFVVTLLEAWAANAPLRERDEDWGEAQLRPGGDGVPGTLQQMIGQQLDRLPAEARRVLEAASVVGADFSTAAVAAALDEREDRVDEHCEALAGRGRFLRSRGVDAGAAGDVAGRYEFIHALHRQVLYERLSATRRARLHRRIGAWHEGAYGALAHEHAAELAVHFEKGHDPVRALHYLDAAARNAMRRHAYHEAAALLGRALARLAALPPGEDRRRQELPLRMALGTSLLTTRGYAAPEVHEAFARAYELCRHLEDGPELPFALAGLFRFFFVGGEFQRASELGEQVLRIAESRDRSLLPVAHSLVGLPRLSLADFSAARAHLEQAIALYDFEQHRSLATQHGDDPALISLGFLAIALWFVGHPDGALSRIREAEALAERLATPYGIAFAHSFAAWIHVHRREAVAAQARCDALLRLAAEQGFAFFIAEGSALRGWALVQQGRVEPGLAQLREGLSAHRALGSRMGRPTHIALLADACGRAGRPEAGLEALDEAFATAAETGERSYEAELHRLKGELLAQRAGGEAGARAEARACLQRAVEIAREQGTRSFELRALMSLVRLDGARRRESESRRRLSELYASFNEGLGAPDLAAARSLLEASPPRSA